MAIRKFSTASISTGSKSSKFWDQQSYAVGDYDLIDTIAVTSLNVGTVSFANIPQNYMHLQLRASIRTDSNLYNYSSIYLYPNPATTTSYTVHQLYTEGATGPSASGRGAGSDNYYLVQNLSGGLAPTYHFGSALIDIYNYTNTNHYKMMRSVGGYDNTSAGDGWLFMNSSIKTDNTNAITQINAACDGNFEIGSIISLYGIRG